MWDSRAWGTQAHGVLSSNDDDRRCLCALACYLEAMACQGLRKSLNANVLEGVEAGIKGRGYSLRFQGDVGRLRRVLAVMDTPYPQRFVVGRWLAEGRLRVCPAGAQLLVDYLRNEGLLADFLDDLEESLTLLADGTPRPFN